ncbi:hypothetical protein DFH09DRAFT_1087210 [Mycena vulgaris]|nr:hypothetical protein DFH09DRAFT_1087210 [Mycena vulgaris]
MVKFRCCHELRSKNSGRPKAPIKAILEQERLGNMKEGWRGQFKKRILSTKDKTIGRQDNPGRRGEMIHEGRDERGLLIEDCRLKLGSLNLGKMNLIIKSRQIVDYARDREEVGDKRRFYVKSGRKSC